MFSTVSKSAPNMISLSISKHNLIPWLCLQVKGIIISPTRELASQIFDVAEPFVKTLSNVRPMLLVGGNEVKDNVKIIEEEGVNLMIGTPGRLGDIMDRMDFLDFKDIEVESLS